MKRGRNQKSETTSVVVPDTSAVDARLKPQQSTNSARSLNAWPKLGAVAAAGSASVVVLVQV